MTLYDTVISNLKGVIGSTRDGVFLHQLDSEYQLMAGENIPLRKLGYDTIGEFMENHHELFRLRGAGQYCRVMNKVGKDENNATLDLISLIQNTQPKYKKKRNIPKVTDYNSQIYQPKLKSYQSKYSTAYQSHLQNGFKTNDFNNQRSNNFKANFPITFNTDLRTPRTFNDKYNGFYKHPNVNSRLAHEKFENKNPKLTAPVTHLINPKLTAPATYLINPKLPAPTTYLVNSKVAAEKSSVLIISDDEEPTISSNPYVISQTDKRTFDTNRNLFFTFQTIDLANMIIDVIFEFKLLKLDGVLKIKIDGELYYHFRLFTGLNIDPIIFKDYVVLSVDSPEIQHFYRGVLYLDPSKIYCIFNPESLLKTKYQLSEYIFDNQGEYLIEIVKLFENNFIGYKVIDSFKNNLDWKKNKISEEAKEIIESQRFWSWIPGSLCLVRLPYDIVKEWTLSSVERAVIISTEIVTLKEVSDSGYFTHNTSFYLIDHAKEIENVLSCASSFQQVKLKVKENNSSGLAFVCNMSISAKGTPAKIQFTQLENYKNISKHFLDSAKQLKPNTFIVLKNIKKTKVVFNFQTIISCSSQVHRIIEKPQEEIRELRDYGDIVRYQNGSKENIMKEGNRDTIVISDSEDEAPPSRHTSKPLNSISNISLPVKAKNCLQVQNVSFRHDSPQIQPQITVNNNSKSIIKTENIAISDTPIKIAMPLDINNETGKSTLSSKYFEKVNCVSSTPYSSSHKNNETISIVSYSDSDDNGSLSDCDPNEKSLIKDKNDVTFSNSTISYLESNLNHSRKCLKPLTFDLINVFNGQIVKILHLQTGSAVLMIFDSIKLMKLEIMMMSLKKLALRKVQNVSVGNFFIWRQNNDDIINCVIVEIMQLTSKQSVLTNNVHTGLLAVVNIDELYCLPENKYGDMRALVGLPVGVFDLHMIPDWFSPDESFDFSNQLFTAFFTKEDEKLILEYIDEPCRFLNIEMISMIEKSLTVNHCNIKSSHFIEQLSKNLLQCRLLVGNILVMLEEGGKDFDHLPIRKVICQVSDDDKNGIWIASVLSVRGGDGDGSYNKISPHNFLDDKFCIDRVTFDKKRRNLRLLDHQNIFIDLPDNFEGLYKLDIEQIRGSLKGNREYYTRYTIAGLLCIPDLKYLHNKLIFDI